MVFPFRCFIVAAAISLSSYATVRVGRRSVGGGGECGRGGVRVVLPTFIQLEAGDWRGGIEGVVSIYALFGDHPCTSGGQLWVRESCSVLRSGGVLRGGGRNCGRLGEVTSGVLAGAPGTVVNICLRWGANLDGTKDQSFYTINDLLCHYRCQIPELIGRLIRGYFHGWVVLSSYNNVMWSIWNPVTREIINFPPLIMYDAADYEFGGDCCLSFPPDDTSSILLLAKSKKPTFVFCQLDYKTKGLGWIEMSYANQLERIAGDNGLLRDLTFFNGKVYALHVARDNLVIQVNIVVKDGGAVIKLFLLGPTPIPSLNFCPGVFSFLKGSSTEMFYITLAYNELTKKTLGNVYLFKWDMTSSMRWEQMDEIDSKDYMKIRKLRTIASELEGDFGEAMCTLQSERERDNEGKKIVVRSVIDNKEVELNESHLLNTPLHILETIMQLCVGVEYKTSALRKYSLVSPWLMVMDKNRGIFTFTDLMFGDKYFMKKSQVSVVRPDRACCSTFGWLLFYSSDFIDVCNPDFCINNLVFFNPFTNDVRKLPSAAFLHILSFLAPPTSPMYHYWIQKRRWTAGLHPPCRPGTALAGASFGS
ncbi:hypothetical protein Tco_0554301 [Tanacetum coccineum]